MMALESERAGTVLGRYVVYDEIAAGGMATVHLGRLLGAAGFARTVAIKRLHAQYAKDPEFVHMFMAEARVTSRIRHPNVVTTVDVVSQQGELFVIMEYIHGESLSKLIRTSTRAGDKIPPRVVVAIMAGALHGLHAAHEATDELGNKLHVVHRDVSPQNILVGLDGISRVLDFGVAKVAGTVSHTREGEIKGKFAYMPPEQLHGERLDRRADIYAAGIVLWEALTCERLFHRSAEALDIGRLLAADVDPPSSRVPDLPPGLDSVTLRALGREPQDRYATAREMALALEACAAQAPPSEVSAWVEDLAGQALAKRGRAITAMEAEPVPADIESPDSFEGRLSVETAMLLLDADPDATHPDVRPPPPASFPSISGETRSATRLRSKPSLSSEIGEASARTQARVDEKPEEKGPRRWIAVPIVLGAAALVALGIVLGRVQFGASPEVAAVPSATTPAESTALAPPPPPSAPMASAEPPESAAPSASAPIAPASAAPRPRASAAPPAIKSTSAAPRPRVPDPCDPPFTIDEQGHKRYKRGCL